jgi:Protein of unknown function (DUF3800)
MIDTPIDLEYIDVFLGSFAEPWAVLLAYIDESGTDEKSPAMYVVGALYKRKAQKKLNREWKKELKRFGISHFHTVDCAHGAKQFKGKSKELRDEAYQSFIKIVKKHIAAAACVATIPESQFNALRRGSFEYSQYTTCTFICIQLLLTHARKLGHHKVDFFLESGPKHGELVELIKLARHHPKWQLFRSYAFVEKDFVGALQTADILAYEFAKRARDYQADPTKAIRKSFKALAHSTSNWTVAHMGPVELELFAETLNAIPKKTINT